MITVDDIFDWLEEQDCDESLACVELIRALYGEVDDAEDFYTETLEKLYQVKRGRH